MRRPLTVRALLLAVPMASLASCSMPRDGSVGRSTAGIRAVVYHMGHAHGMAYRSPGDVPPLYPLPIDLNGDGTDELLVLIGIPGEKPLLRREDLGTSKVVGFIVLEHVENRDWPVLYYSSGYALVLHLGSKDGLPMIEGTDVGTLRELRWFWRKEDEGEFPPPHWAAEYKARSAGDDAGWKYHPTIYGSSPK